MVHHILCQDVKTPDQEFGHGQYKEDEKCGQLDHGKTSFNW